MIGPAATIRGPGHGRRIGRYFFDITGAASGWHVLQFVIPRLLLSRTVSGVGAGGASMWQWTQSA